MCYAVFQRGYIQDAAGLITSLHVGEAATDVGWCADRSIYPTYIGVYIPTMQLTNLKDTKGEDFLASTESITPKMSSREYFFYL